MPSGDATVYVPPDCVTIASVGTLTSAPLVSSCATRPVELETWTLDWPLCTRTRICVAGGVDPSTVPG